MSDGCGAIYPAILNSIIGAAVWDIRWTIPQVIRAEWMSSRKLGSTSARGRRIIRSRLPHAAVHVAGVGYGPGGIRAGRGGVDAGIRGCCRRSTGCCQKRSGTRATGGEEVGMRSRGGWYFDSTMSFTRMWIDTGQVLLALNRGRQSAGACTSTTCASGRLSGSSRCSAGMAGGLASTMDNTRF